VDLDQPGEDLRLYPKKGTLAIGSDADIAIWDPKKSVTFSDKTVKDSAGYTPWKGRTVKGWPTTVLLRGEVLVEHEKLRAKPGQGTFLARHAGKAADRSAAPRSKFDPKRNFGARLR
jgi:dihydropyrimidinase